MNKIQHMLQDLCPNGVEWKTLGEVCEILDYKRKPISKGCRTKGEYPYYGANGIQDYVDDYIFDGTYLLVGEDGSVINKDNSPIINWATGKIWVNNHAHILSEIKEVAILRYLYFALQCVDVSDIVHGTPPKLNQANLRNISIPIPPLPVQAEIVNLLDKFTLLSAELKAELKLRRKQYDYYRNHLLSFDSNSTTVHWMPLGEVAEFQNGFAFKSTLFQKKGKPILRISNIQGGQIDTDSLIYFNETSYKEDLSAYQIQPNRIVIAMSGATTGKIGVNRTDTILYLNQRVGMFIPNESIILNNYLYHFLAMNENTFYHLAGGGAQPNLSTKDIKSFLIPIPPIAEQERIVGILDKFETLVNDLSKGLPAEIALVQKQYEYYRNLLFTFE